MANAPNVLNRFSITGEISIQFNDLSTSIDCVTLIKEFDIFQSVLVCTLIGVHIIRHLCVISLLFFVRLYFAKRN